MPDGVVSNPAATSPSTEQNSEDGDRLALAGDGGLPPAEPENRGDLAQSDDAPDAIGVAEVVLGTVTVTRADGTSEPLQAGDPVFEGDTLVTSDGANVGLEFVDESQFSLAENGTVRLDELVFDPSGAGSSEMIQVIQGTFAFVSGQIAKTGDDAMMVNTPVATIGVRGTTVAGTVDENGALSVSLLPDSEGTLGEIAVFNEGGLEILFNAYQQSFVTSESAAPSQPVLISPDESQSLYGGAVNALPERAAGRGGELDESDPGDIEAIDTAALDMVDGAIVDGAGTVHVLKRPGASEVVEVQAGADHRLDIEFDLDDVDVAWSSGSLVFRFEDGGEIRVKVSDAVSADLAPMVLLADGTLISIEDVLALTGGVDILNGIVTAAGDALGTGTARASDFALPGELSHGLQAFGAQAGEDGTSAALEIDLDADGGDIVVNADETVPADVDPGNLGDNLEDELEDTLGIDVPAEVDAAVPDIDVSIALDPLPTVGPDGIQEAATDVLASDAVPPLVSELPLEEPGGEPVAGVEASLDASAGRIEDLADAGGVDANAAMAALDAGVVTINFANGTISATGMLPDEPDVTGDVTDVNTAIVADNEDAVDFELEASVAVTESEVVPVTPALAETSSDPILVTDAVENGAPTGTVLQDNPDNDIDIGDAVGNPVVVAPTLDALGESIAEGGLGSSDVEGDLAGNVEKGASDSTVEVGDVVDETGNDLDALLDGFDTGETSAEPGVANNDEPANEPTGIIVGSTLDLGDDGRDQDNGVLGSLGI